jgi:DNA-directed RNA polymerase specialized sigma24 family protein
MSTFHLSQPQRRGSPSYGFMSSWKRKVAGASFTALILLGASPGWAAPQIKFSGTPSQWSAVACGHKQTTAAMIETIKKKAVHIVYGPSAEDVAQEVAIAFIKKAPVWAQSPPSSFNGLVSTAVKHRSINDSLKLKEISFSSIPSDGRDAKVAKAVEAAANSTERLDAISYFRDSHSHSKDDPSLWFENESTRRAALKALTTKQINVLTVTAEQENLSEAARQLGMTRYEVQKTIDQARKNVQGLK